LTVTDKYVLAIEDDENSDIAFYQEALRLGRDVSVDDFKVFRYTQNERKINHLAIEEKINSIVAEVLDV